jgi:hypothetical protein
MTTANTEEQLPTLPGIPPKGDDGTPMTPQGPTHHESEPTDLTNGGEHTDGPTHHEQPTNP